MPDPTTARTRPRPWRQLRDGWADLSPLFVGYRGKIAVLAVLAVAAGVVEAALLALIAAVAAALTQTSSRVDLELGAITTTVDLWVLFTAAFALCVARAVLQLALAYLPASMAAAAMARLRGQLFDSYTRTSWPVQAAERDGHFQSLMTTHVNSTTQAIVAVGSGISGAALFLTLIASAFVLSVGTALIMVVASAGLFLMLRPAARRLRASATALSAENLEYSQGVQEVVLVAEETQVFGVSETYRDSFYRSVDAVRRPLLRTRFLSTATPALFQSVALLLLVVALLVVSVAGSGSVASLGAIVLILVRALSFAQQLQQAIANVNMLSPFMTRLAAAIEHYDTHAREDGDRPLARVERVGLRSVGFSYGSEPVLTDIDVEVTRGQALGIIGPSGAGKSSIVQLLLRLRLPTAGVVAVNDEDARDYRLADWQQRVAYVPQVSQLVHGSVADNIRFYRPGITDAQVEQAARRAHVHDEIMGWESGYDTVIGQRASAVSGGQRQRLCVARALAGQPDVLVLDEPTSALDTKSEALLQATLSDIKKDLVLFLVAHRLSTLAVCDRVMVLVDGQVQAVGTPADLTTTNAYFREVTEISDRRAT